MTEQEIRVIEDLKASDVLAYKFQDAARVIGLSYSTIYREMALGHIHPLRDWKLISRNELIRWVKEREHKPVPRKRAKRIDASHADDLSLSE